MKTADALWAEVKDQVFNYVKVYVLQQAASELLMAYKPRIDQIVRRYARFLPSFVSDSEGDDLQTVAQLEFIEAFKVWVPEKSPDIWPLAQMRMIGAMKDHIRYISKSDPSRFYDWITDAAYVFTMVNKRADFEQEIETGDQLSQAMQTLTDRERLVVVTHTKDDKTFKQIGDELGISESQISRIYKKALEKMKKRLQP
ncbi:MAG: sigma-70 family RNA polymerase sigma factor [Candidatus Margulisiibacteriota bacterium]